MGWYGPLVGVGLAALIGVGVAIQVRLARRSAEAARSTEPPGRSAE
jgi:hypothetical protein